MVIASVLFLAHAMETTAGPGERDFISYWSAGQLLDQGANPYGPAEVLRLEQREGYRKSAPLIMRNPPWALFLVIPLGWMSPVAGNLAWALGILAATMASMIPWRHNGSGDHVFAYFFAPILACMMLGQTSAFLLAGFTLFLIFGERRPFLAGAALLLMSIKPHLFVPFWLVLSVDAVRRRQFTLLAGLACACAAAFALSFSLDPLIWNHYLAMMRYEQIDREFVQTPSYLLRALLLPGAKWVQFAPVALASVWALSFYRLLLLPVSLLAAPYGCLTDEIVLLPLVLLGIYARRKLSLEAFLAINGVIAILGILHFSITSGAYIWTTTAWLLWFLYARPGTASSTDAGDSLVPAATVS